MMSSELPGQVQVQPLRWEEHRSLKADVILGADLLYDPGDSICLLASCWFSSFNRSGAAPSSLAGRGGRGVPGSGADPTREP